MASVPVIVNQILDGLQREKNKRIPFCLLYDQRGSEIYTKITELESYYLFQAEKSLLQKNAHHIAEEIDPDSLIVELGCGVADKTGILLNAIQETHHRCHYIGIDVSQSALNEAVQMIDKSKGVQLEFVQADYLEGLKLVRRKYPDKLICILWLGSSIGNLSESECTDFAKEVLKLVGSRCQMILCVDIWKEEEILRGAYQDEQGVTESFIKNGMRRALDLLDHPVSESELEESWKYEVEINRKLRQVEMYVRFPRGLDLPQHAVCIRENERVLVEISRKFTDEDILQHLSEAGFVFHAKWGSKHYACYMILSCEEAVLRCWKDTDELFQGLSDWFAQPVSYRHPFCFYYGHVLAFAKLKLLDSNSDSIMNTIFSRGMDPLMLDPSKCHNRPETPPQWPDKETLTNYVRDGRAEVLDYLKAGEVNIRSLNLILEHERMHQETLSYMIVQQRKKQSAMSEGDIANPTPSKILSKVMIKNPDVRISKGTAVLGSDPVPGVFRFDNEQPSFSAEIENDFWVSSSPVSIGEFMTFVSEGGYERQEFWEPGDFQFLKNANQRFPATWSSSASQGEYYVHYPDRTLPWTEAAFRPVYVSLMEAEAFCKWRGWRLMTEAEYHRILKEEEVKERVKSLRDDGWEWTSTPLRPFPGFQTMEEYPEYSIDFFDGLHFVLKGSSPVTHASLIRDSFRNFYQRQYPYAFAKFRCCK